MSLLNTAKWITSHPLNRGRELHSMLRFAKWQVGGRLFGGIAVCDWVNGCRFFARIGESGITGNIYAGLRDFSDMSFLLHFLRREDLFVDIGANSGAYSILAGAVVGAMGVAFEPVPATYKRLVENMHLNYLDQRVECVNKAVGAQPAVLSFSSGSDSGNHALAPGEVRQDAISVEVTTVDEALRGASPALIKIDVEGYETAVLQGAPGTLQAESLRAVILEIGHESRYGYEGAQVLELMFDHGFRIYSYRPLKRQLVELKEIDRSEQNTLFLRDLPYVEARVRSAPYVTVHGQVF